VQRTKEVRDMIRELGLTIMEMKHNGANHIRMILLTPSGKPFEIICAHTPSDKRGLMNQRAYIRRKVKELDK
jgi:hypothetical protein